MRVQAYASGNVRTDLKKAPRMQPNYKAVMYNSVLGSRNTPGVGERMDALQPGLHLHFILPDMFTHSPDGEDYPAVPNRFVVTRIWQDDKSGKLGTKCSVVESDFVSTEKIYDKSITIPCFQDPDERRRWRYLGRNYPAGTNPAASAQDGYLDKLTALGAGDPYFASYYPNCSSVFGYYDDLQDLPPRTLRKLTYYVLGYFSDPANDPFHNACDRKKFEEILNANNLCVSSGLQVCNSCVVYGAVDAIEWKGFDEEYCPAPQGKVNISFGNTSAEALSLAIRKSLGEEDGAAERMLTALQYELYDETLQPDGNFKIDDEIHLRTFARCSALEENDIFFFDREHMPEQPIGAEYSQLKRQGMEIGKRKRELLSEQNKLYCLWEQYVLLYEEGDERKEYPKKRDLLDELERVCRKVEDLKTECKNKLDIYNEYKGRLAQKLPENASFKKNGGGSFFFPKNPVLLLSGPGVHRSYAFGEDGRFTSNGALFCQTQAVTANIEKNTILEQCFTDIAHAGKLHPAFDDLLVQTVLLCRDLKAAIASIAGMITISGALPSPVAINSDPLEWTTLYMLWGAEYSPTRTASSPDNTLSDWEFSYGDTNLCYKGGLTPEKLNHYNLSGKIILTPHAVKAFRNMTENYIKLHGEDDELKELAEKIGDLPVISQNLSGFTSYFSGLWQALQFPVMGIGDDGEIARRVALQINDERLSILPESDLMPLRGGYIKITDLVLVSSFGQTQTLIQNSYYNGCEVDFAESVNCGIKDYGLLPPSFQQPVRISADFVNAQDNSVFASPAPETSPIAGIVLPEMLNRRLLAYTAQGQYLGMIKTVYRLGKPQARWLSSPQLDPDFNNLSIPDKTLKAFLRSLIQTDGTFFEFNSLMDRFLDAKQYTGALIWGRPLVLARMKLSVDFYGRPAFSKRFEDFRRYDTLGAEDACIPLYFGDMNRVADGLFSCFNGDDFTRLYPPFGAASDSATNKYVQYQKCLPISASDGERFFTILMEPSSTVHLQSGLLPPVALQLEAVHTQIAESLELSAEISPVLASPEGVELPPLPQARKGAAYKWYAPEKESYKEYTITPPIVSFQDTILMDGLIVKEKES